MAELQKLRDWGGETMMATLRMQPFSLRHRVTVDGPEKMPVLAIQLAVPLESISSVEELHRCYEQNQIQIQYFE